MSYSRIQIPGDEGHVFAVVIEGPLDASMITEMIDFIREKEREGRKARIYVDLHGSIVFDRGMLGTAKEKLLHMKEIWTGIERCAYVMDNDLLEGLIPVFDAITPMDLRIFEHDEIDEARAWIVGD